MTELALVIGDKNLSSWSMRPWIALKQANLPFREVNVRLDRKDTPKEIKKYSPSGRVPVLHHGNVVVWESLAILEYLAETYPKAQLWPEDRNARAAARAVAAEMHAGFAAMRAELPMNVLLREPRKSFSDAAKRDLDRVMEIWTTCRRDFARGGPYLFGHFTAADAMFAPVVTRFVTYAVPVDDRLAREYLDTLWALPALKDWIRGAEAENTRPPV